MTTRRKFESYKRKDEALRVYSSWLRLIESDTAPEGQWYCMRALPQQPNFTACQGQIGDNEDERVQVRQPQAA